MQKRGVLARWFVAAGILALGVTTAPGVGAEGATLHVENNGVDSPACGAKTSPCRSISQAIANAPVPLPRARAPVILVGPGRYGDLDDSGSAGTGEELPNSLSCMLAIGKRVTVHSTHGAAVTVIHGGGSALQVVCIEASGVVFGQPQRGFTLVAGGVGVGVGEPGQFVNEVRLGGNLATALAFTGFLVAGGSDHVLTGNLAINTGRDGFELGGSGLEITDNLAIANVGSGFRVGSASPAGGSTLSGNVASGNGEDGFATSGPGHALERNHASGNGRDGFAIRGNATALRTSAALGNVRAGVSVGDPALGSAPVGVSVETTNLFGNNPTPVGGLVNCGLLNQSGNLVSASNNFWGAATGPGPEPADVVCDARGSTTATPFVRNTPVDVPTAPLW